MNIVRVRVFECDINSGSRRYVKKGFCREVRGKVEESLMQLNSGGEIGEVTVELKVNNKKHKLHGVGFPRIDVGEEIILYFDFHYVRAIQVIRNGQAIFRLILSQELSCAGSLGYAFEE